MDDPLVQNDIKEDSNNDQSLPDDTLNVKDDVQKSNDDTNLNDVEFESFGVNIY